MIHPESIDAIKDVGRRDFRNAKVACPFNVAEAVRLWKLGWTESFLATYHEATLAGDDRALNLLRHLYQEYKNP